MSEHHELVVVGRGMIGSAATRHLADAGHSVTLIGPPEPATYDGAGPFASHYDQGRVTRITGFDKRWGAWARASIDRYPEIASRSGIDFHNPVGLLMLAHGASQAAANGAELGADVSMLTKGELLDRYGIASINDDHEISFEGPPAGVINPRKLVEAQLACAEQAGATIIDDVVVALDEDGSGVSLELRSDRRITAERVLLCTGAYGAELLGDNMPLDRRLRTIVMAEISNGPDFPALIVHDLANPVLEGAYWTPPMLFPDGRTMVKIGGDSVPPVLASSVDDIGPWFRDGGSTQEADSLVELLRQMLPGRTITPQGHRPCVVSNTPDFVPHIQSVSDRIAVGFGGCGASAKSSDELGRLASVELLA